MSTQIDGILPVVFTLSGQQKPQGETLLFQLLSFKDVGALANLVSNPLV